MSNKIDLRIIKTKKSLCEGLVKLMQEKRFEDIKVSDICQVSLVNRSTFYDHFSDKYELLSYFIDNLRNELEDDLNKNDTGRNSGDYYIKGIEIFLNHISDNISIYSSVLKNNSEGMLLDITYYTLIKDVQRSIDKSNMAKRVPSEIASRFFVSGIINVCIEYIKYPEKYTKEDMLNYLVILLSDTIQKS